MLEIICSPILFAKAGSLCRTRAGSRGLPYWSPMPSFQGSNGTWTAVANWLSHGFLEPNSGSYTCRVNVSPLNNDYAQPNDYF